MVPTKVAVFSARVLVLPEVLSESATWLIFVITTKVNIKTDLNIFT